MPVLEQRVVAITGAGRGIGAAVARLCAAEGAAVVVNDIGVALDGSGTAEAPAAAVVAEVQKAGGLAIQNADDIATAEGGAALIESALDAFGKVDVLVNCAGILRDKMIFNMPEEDWDAVIRVHLRGSFNTIKPAASYWRGLKNPDGDFRIINFTSNSGLSGAPGQPNYAAAKMGIVGLTYSCARALRRYGVTSNAVSPAAATRMASSIPGSRIGVDLEAEEMNPRNVAPVVAYLASAASSWCNGQVLGARGYSVSLYNRPAPVAELHSDVPWDLTALGTGMESKFRRIASEQVQEHGEKIT